MLAGTVAALVFELESHTVQPPEPAAVVSVAVPVPVCPLTIVLGWIDKALRAAAGTTLILEVMLVPEKEAVRVTGVELLTEAVLTENVAEVEPWATVTDFGTDATEELELASVTTAPPVPALALSVTVPVPDWPPVIVEGFTERLAGTIAGGFTVTPVVMVVPE